METRTQENIMKTFLDWIRQPRVFWVAVLTLGGVILWTDPANLIWSCVQHFFK